MPAIARSMCRRVLLAAPRVKSRSYIGAPEFIMLCSSTSAEYLPRKAKRHRSLGGGCDLRARRCGTQLHCGHSGSKLALFRTGRPCERTTRGSSLIRRTSREIDSIRHSRATHCLALHVIVHANARNQTEEEADEERKISVRIDHVPARRLTGCQVDW